MGILSGSIAVPAEDDEDNDSSIVINETITLYDEDGNIIEPNADNENGADSSNESVTQTQQATNRPRLFPSGVEELHFENSRRVIRTYHLTPDENPMDINTESFERDGFFYTLQDITRNRKQYVSIVEHLEIIEIETASAELNDILSRLEQYIEFETADGYNGVLRLVLSSVVTEVAGTRSEGFTQTETRTYPNLSNPDVSLIPQTITVGGRELTLSGVTWAGGSQDTIDYTRIAQTYTATATYTRNGIRNITLGYITTAHYVGELTRINEGETSYTAIFFGVPINTPMANEADEDDADGMGANGNQENELREPFAVNRPLLLSILGGLGLIGAAAWFFFIRGNVIVYNLEEMDGDYIKIGRVRIGSSNKYIVDLTPFTDKTKTSAFKLVMSGWTASKLDKQTITANFGSGTLQHEIAYVKGQKDYSVLFDF